MLNWFAKLLLVATSLAPMLTAVAVNQLEKGEPFSRYAPWLVVAVLLGVICWLLLVHLAQSGEVHKFRVKGYERKDIEVLAFLLTYLLPFISSDKLAFTGEWLAGAYILAIIFIAIVHSGAFHFNPVMGLLGYHFYAVKSTGGTSHLLITRVPSRRLGKEVQVVKLSENVYLQTGA